MSQRPTPEFLRQHQLRFRFEEKANRRIVLRSMGRMYDAMAGALDAGDTMAAAAQVEVAISEKEHRTMLTDIYLNTGVRSAGLEYERLTSRPTPAKDDEVNVEAGAGFFSRQWRDRMSSLMGSSETAKRITQMTAHARQLVRDIFSRAMQEGFAPKWTIARIKNLLTGTNARKRATLIARTETTRAMNAGIEAGAETTRLRLLKKWVATSDDRTRPAHLAMIRKKAIPKDDLFLVGGVRMRYPGDPAGGPANVCNCRCRLLYVPAP